MSLQWVPVTKRLPPERRHVLVWLPAIGVERDDVPPECRGWAPAICVGYLKFAAGDENCPYFVTPGVTQGHRKPTHWADCLPDDARDPMKLWAVKP